MPVCFRIQSSIRKSKLDKIWLSYSFSISMHENSRGTEQPFLKILLLYHLIRRDTRQLANEAFTSNPIASSKQQLSGLKITNNSCKETAVLKNVFLKILKMTQESTCSEIFFKYTCNFIQKETPAQVFFCEFYKTFKHTVLAEHLQETASNLHSVIQ